MSPSKNFAAADSEIEIQSRLDNALRRSFTMKPEPHAKPKRAKAKLNGKAQPENSKSRYEVAAALCFGPIRPEIRHAAQGLEVILNDGTQQRIVDALLCALIKARAQLGSTFKVLNVVPDVRTSATEVDHDIPVT